MSQNLTSPPTSPVRYDVSLLTAEDLYLFNEGSHYRLHDKMGAHLTESNGCGRDGVQRVGAECAQRAT